MKIQKFGEADFMTSSWQGGTTTQLFIYPRNAKYSERNFLFRLSSATVDLEKSEFTALPNIRRFISPLTGNLKISHDEKRFTKLKPYEIYAFDGGIKTVSVGKVRDFNVMVKDGTDASVKSFFLAAGSVLKFGVSKKEIGWLFSYNTRCGMTVKTEDAQTFQFVLEKMTLIVFEFEDGEQTHNAFISADADANLLYGKIVLPD